MVEEKATTDTTLTDESVLGDVSRAAATSERSVDTPPAPKTTKPDEPPTERATESEQTPTETDALTKDVAGTATADEASMGSTVANAPEPSDSASTSDAAKPTPRPAVRGRSGHTSS
jgi:hypothetical protein